MSDPVDYQNGTACSSATPPRESLTTHRPWRKLSWGVLRDAKYVATDRNSRPDAFRVSA